MSGRKLSNADVIQILAEHGTGTKTGKELAKYWGVTEACISNLLNNKTYKEVTLDENIIMYELDYV